MRHRSWDFYLPPQFRVRYESIQSKMLRRSKLALRVTEAASAVCGITFHPNGMDGGLTTVTLTLLLSTALSRLARLCRAGGVRLPTFTTTPLQKHSHLPISAIHMLWHFIHSNTLICHYLSVCLPLGLYLREVPVCLSYGTFYHSWRWQRLLSGLLAT